MECTYVPSSKVLTLKITEEIDEHTTEKMRRKMDNEITRFLPRKVVFDFSNVTFMDSAGIGMVIGRYKRLIRFGGKAEMINISDDIKRIFNMVGIFRIIPLVDKEDK